MNKTFSRAVALAFVMHAVSLHAQSQEDLDKVKAQIVALHARLPAPEVDVQGWLKSQKEDGSWADIDYASDVSSGWPSMEHLRRMSIFTGMYAKGKVDGHADEASRDAARKSFDYWLEHTPHSKNWWYGVIGAPTALTDTMIVLEEVLSADEKAKGLALTQEKLVPDEKTGKFKPTGQNLVWIATIEFRNALLTHDAAEAKRCRDIIANEVKVTTDEGLQPDQSFQQHGPQQQFGNYGLSFASTMSELGWEWQGTSFALEEERVALLRGFFLQGEAFVVANKTMDISSCGRQLSPGSPVGKARNLMQRLDLMTDVDAAHAEDYRTAIAQASAAAGCGDASLAGGNINKVFYRSDYIVHRRPEYFASLKMCSRRVIGGENTNRENQLGRYLADGALFVYQDSTEYVDIFPVWDWRKLPGVTCAVTSGSMVPAGKMETDFAGGVTDGTHGAAGLDYNRDGVTGRKSWFFFDREIVCLGAGLKGGVGITTGIEQCLLKSDVIAGAAGKDGAVQTPGRHDESGADWVWHNGRGYVLPGKQNVVLSGTTQTGSWRDVSVSGSDGSVSKQVFSLWIDHGAKVSDASYVYTVLTARTAKETSAWASAPTKKVLSNTADVQAVESTDSKLGMAVFYKPGKIECKLGTVSVDAPCALILDESTDHPRVTISDPSQLGSKVQVAFNGKTVEADLPQGAEAGKSVAVEWK